MEELMILLTKVFSPLSCDYLKIVSRFWMDCIFYPLLSRHPFIGTNKALDFSSPKL